jgi:tetrahydromethanopterin S-methyltransferase subunit E
MVGNWTGLVIGIIIIISPWVLGFSDISLAKWSNIIVGLVLVLMNAWIVFGESASTAVSVAASMTPATEGVQRGRRKAKNSSEQK